MTPKPDFQHMSPKELRNYVLSHYEDEKALRVYMARLHNEPAVIRQTEGLNQENLKQLKQLIEKRIKDRNT